ncbi:MAG: LicD family protein [Lachnospiraceae bacterium]|nr:LicD family protein [Lachnospiraceae bacterium]
MDAKNEYLFWLTNIMTNELPLDAKRRIFLETPKAVGTTRGIQLAENQILRTIKQTCDKNNLNFFLMGGTLLGAVRHRGFIPWDDDIDIGMMKPDLMKLISIINESPDSMIQIKKYYQFNGGTVYKAKYKFTKTIFVDIFPFEPLNATDENANTVWEETQNIASDFSSRILAEVKAKGLYQQSLVTPVASEEMDLFFRNLEQELANCKYLGQGPYFSECIENGYKFRKSRGLLKFDDLYPLLTDEVEFEGEKYSAWKNYMTRLEMFFGDIYSFPKCIVQKHKAEFEGVENDLQSLIEKKIIEVEK